MIVYLETGLPRSGIYQGFLRYEMIPGEALKHCSPPWLGSMCHSSTHLYSTQDAVQQPPSQTLSVWFLWALEATKPFIKRLKFRFTDGFWECFSFPMVQSDTNTRWLGICIAQSDLEWSTHIITTTALPEAVVSVIRPHAGIHNILFVDSFSCKCICAVLCLLYIIHVKVNCNAASLVLTHH